MSDNKRKLSNTRQMSSKAPPQIANFFSKPLSPNNDLSPSTSTKPSAPPSPPSSNERKRKLSEQESSSQNGNRNTYEAALQKDAAKISKVQKTKKVGSMVTKFFQQGSSDDLSDLFESPHKRMQFKPPPAIPKKKATRKRKPNAKQTQTKNVLETEIFEKVLLHHSSADGLSSDDLQMAIALSRSLTDTHGSNGESSSVSSLIRNAAPFEKEDIVRETFQKFGFKKGNRNGYVEYDYRDFFANFGSKKKWKSKFTPLTRRSEYMQQEKFKNKVKKILKISETDKSVDCEVVQEYIVTSHYLQQFFIPKSPSYCLSSADTNTFVEDFYVNDLVPISTLRCGCLLKSWTAIPGRDASPQKSASEPCNVDNSTIATETHNESTFCSIIDRRVDDVTENLNGATECVERDEITNSSQVIRSANPLIDHSMDADGITGDNLPKERELFSPDMFADYESSPNTSLNDHALPGRWNDQNAGRSSNSPNDSYSESQGSENGRINSRDKVVNAAPVYQKEKEVIALSSDDSNQGCSKITVEPINVVNQPKSVDIPSIFTIAKHLSFTDRLELYNSDLALGNNDDYPMCQLSQDSVVISDDEINYSLNCGTCCDDFAKLRTMDMHSQESIVLSDSDDQMASQLPDDDIEERKSFVSIDMCNENEINSNQSLNDDDRINLSVRKLCEKNIGSSLVHSNNHSQESIELSDSDEQMASQLPENEIEERQSFASIEIGNESDFASDKSLDEDINIDDELFNSNHSLNDEDLINLSVREMCQKEFVSGSAKASTSNSFSRTTSDMTFERKHFKPSKTPNKFNNFSDDEFDEFDKLVRGNRHPSPAPNSNSIEISDDEFDKSFKSQPDNIRVDDDLITLDSPPPTECNEFIVQSMDHIYEVRTGKLVSPKPDYENMDSPTRLVHLKKYGLKTLSKRKAVICLEHIYNRLHPFIELNERDNLDDILSQKGIRAIDANENRIGDMDDPSEPSVKNHFDALQENEDIFFLPSAPRAKKPWCLQPLHIAWHNLIDSNPTLYDDILQYKPVDLLNVRSLLKSIDLRYETNDLISFLDRKCITFKTDNKRNNAVKKNC